MKELIMPKKLSINPKKGIWQYQEAKAKLSLVMDNVTSKGMQIIIRNKDEIFIVLSEEKFNEYQQKKESLIQFFKNSPYPEIELDIKRQKDLPRELDL